MVPTYSDGSAEVTLTITDELLPAGTYRLTVFSDITRSIHDVAGLTLDGDSNGTQGGNYVRTFVVQPYAIWTGLGDDMSWQNPDNWRNSTVPNASHNVFISGASGPVLVAGTASARSITCSGDLFVTGSLSISATSVVEGSLELQGGGQFQLIQGQHATLVVHELQIDGSSSLDLADNDLVIDYSNATPIVTVEGKVRTGFNGGDWLGTGITSSTAASEDGAGNYVLAVADNAQLAAPYGTANGGGLFSGIDVDLSSVLVKFTHRVDLNLDGLITDSDAITFSTNFELGSSAIWAIGDLNYDGVFTDDDSILFGTYYELGLPPI